MTPNMPQNKPLSRTFANEGRTESPSPIRRDLVQPVHGAAHDLERGARGHAAALVPAEGLLREAVPVDLRRELLDIAEGRRDAKAERGQLRVRVRVRARVEIRARARVRVRVRVGVRVRVRVSRDACGPSA